MHLGRRAALLGALAGFARPAAAACAAPYAQIGIDTSIGPCTTAVLLDDQPARMIVDTGSERTVLTRAGVEGELAHYSLQWHDRAAVAVVMAADGYPANPRRHTLIGSLALAEQILGVHVFHAGTELLNGQLVSNGGRVLTVCATGRTIASARTTAYTAVDTIDWPDGFCRRDIAWRALAPAHG